MKDSIWPMTKAIIEAVRYRDTLRAEGASEADLAEGLERVVREAWPKPKHRTEPWRYRCDLCDDTGLRHFVCRQGERCNGISQRINSAGEQAGKYARLCRLSPDSTYEHTYGEPCMCPLGRRFLPPSRSTDDFTKATKSKPMTRFGR